MSRVPKLSQREKRPRTIFLPQNMKPLIENSVMEPIGEKGLMARLASTLHKDPKHRSDTEIDFLFDLTTSSTAIGSLNNNYFKSFVKENGERKLKDLLRYSYFEYALLTEVCAEEPRGLRVQDARCRVLHHLERQCQGVQADR